MKFAKLLVLGILSLMGTNAWAAVPEGVWTMPEPTGLEFTEFTTDGERYILYNPTAKMFFSSGNGWNTMASLRTFGMEIWVMESSEEDAPEGSYELWDNNVNNPARTTGELNMFTDDGNSTWVDHGTQGNYSWGVEINNGLVRFQNVALIADKPEFEGMYLGFDGTWVVADNSAGDASHRDAYTAILRHVSPDAAGAGVDFKAVTVDSYEAFIGSDDYAAYESGVKTYLASIGLKTAIESAEALNIDAADALAIYSDKASTAEDLANAAAALNELIEAKNKLKAAIEDYEGKGFTGTADAKAVLDNPKATKDEIEQALEALDAAALDWGKNNASVQNPADMTSKIVNPHFDNADCTTGWSGDAFGRGGTVSDGAEHYSKNYDSYQTISGLAPGVYAVGVNGFYRAGNYNGDAENHYLADDAASKYAKLYAKVGDTYNEVPIANVLSGIQAEAPGVGEIAVTLNEETFYVPNTMAVADYYFHTLHQYENKLFIAVDDSGELTIGVKKSSQIGGDWSMFDDFSLTYYGTGADAYKLYLDEVLKNYSDVTIEDGVIYTESYLTDYRNSLTNATSASSKEEIDAILEGITGGYERLQTNIELWKRWDAAVENAKQKYVYVEQYAGLDAMDDLSDYCDIDAEKILSAHALTNDELEAEIQKIADMIQAVVDESKNQERKDGDDMTDFIKNPGFDDDADINFGGAEGWTIDRVDGGNVVRGPLGDDNKKLMEGALGYMNYCFESWHCHKWDIWQEISDLPKGMYELNVQGYVRCEVGGYNRGDDLTDYPSPVYLYMNNATAQFPSVYSEAPEDLGYSFTTVESWTTEDINGKLYPNSMGGAAQCFAWGMYKMQAYGLIAQKGDVFRIGVRMDADQDWWCIFDNFKLTYREPTAEVVKPILEDALEKLDLSRAMGSDVYAQASKVKADAEAAIAAGDGEKMFDALVAVYDLNEAIETSVTLFRGLTLANESLYDAIGNSSAADATKTEANALAGKISNGLEEHTFENGDVEGLINDINAMITKLNIPAGYENASDSNPVDFSGVIKNNAYDEGVESWSGTAAAWGSTYGNAEFYNKTFDYYQDLSGLPAGTYEVSVQAFYRAGSAANDYDNLSDESLNNAVLYATTGDEITRAVALIRLGAEAQPATDYDDNGNPAAAADYVLVGDGMQVPNMMSTAGDEFAYDRYKENHVVTKVGEDGFLRVGLKKDVELENDWTLFDNWTLTYYGANSSKELSSSGIADVNTVPTMKVEFFTLDGRKVGKLQKGIIIQKQTLNNGQIVVKKIRK